MLQQFLQTCHLGDPLLNLGGVRVLMDVFWKLFTRRKRFMDTPTYMKSLDSEVSTKMAADNFYHVPFMESVVRVLTSLCIGKDSRAVQVTQDLIAKELLVTNEAAACRRRPEPECYENAWAEQPFTADSSRLGCHSSVSYSTSSNMRSKTPVSPGVLGRKETRARRRRCSSSSRRKIGLFY